MTPRSGSRNWWETRAYALALIVLSAVPLLCPRIAPLVDLPGHMGRYRVQLDIAHTQILQHYYTFQWHMIGNLGVDLLVVPLSALVGLEAAVKLIVMTIPMLTVAGMLAIVRVVHGRLPPTAAFALPLAYGFPFQYGFVNFSLSMALALLAFALWLDLGAKGRIKLRSAIFVPIGLMIWLSHSFGWGFLGLLCGAASVAEGIRRGQGWPTAFWNAGLACLALLPPLILMLAWRSEVPAGLTGDWFNMGAKIASLVAILRTEWRWFDTASMGLLLILIYVAIRSAKLRMARPLSYAALFCLIAFVLLPRILFGSAYADMRLAPFMVALAVLAIAPIDGKWARPVALAASGFFLARMAMTALVFTAHARDIDRNLAALDMVPKGARMVSLVSVPCLSDWRLPRLSHLPGLAIERRMVFTNDQWIVKGANLMETRLPQGEPFTEDPSQMIYPRRCPMSPTLDDAIASIPAGVFSHVWLVGFDPSQWPHRDDFIPVWRGHDAIVYRIVPEHQ